MSTVIAEDNPRTKIALLRRTLIEREQEIEETRAKIVDLEERENEARLLSARTAPKQRMYQVGTEGTSRPLKYRKERENAERKLSSLVAEADAVRAVLVEERAAERAAERQQLIETLDAYDRREAAEWAKVPEAYAALRAAVEDAWQVAEDREDWHQQLVFDDDAFRKEIADYVWSVQHPYPASVLRAVELVEDAGAGTIDRERGGPLARHAPDLIGARKPQASRCERSDSSR